MSYEVTDLENGMRITVLKETRPEILLHPQIPRPLHGLAPRTIKGSKWWDRERHNAYARSNYHCEACGVSQSQALVRRHLEAHEMYDINYLQGRMYFKETVAVCHLCHNFIHFGRIKYLYEIRKITHGFLIEVRSHGDRILSKAGLYKNHDEVFYSLVPWNNWRLVIGNEEYTGKFRSQEEYDTFYETENG